MLNIQLSPQLQAKSQKIVIGACSPKVCPHYIELNPLLPQSLFNCDYQQLPTAELKYLTVSNDSNFIRAVNEPSQSFTVAGEGLFLVESTTSYMYI